MSDFTNLENIYRIFKPARELAAEKLTGGKTGGPDSIVSQLQELLVNSGNGSYPISVLKQHLESLAEGAERDQINKLNRWISFYSSSGFLSYQNSTRSYFDAKSKALKNDLKFEQISGVKEEEFNSRPMSICQVRNGFISPATRDASKVETFLNFMPPTMLAQCIPYMELEFVFDRPFSSDNTLSTPSLLKFLMGGAEVVKDENNPNTVMYRSAYGTTGEVTPASGEEPEKDNRRVQTSAGMEIFTSPQTLINLDPVANQLRYVPVLDPMRPFMTLENVTIDIKGTTGVMCHKTAQVAIKLHDKSRLSELADMIQPAAYGRATVWLTYGWRFPAGSADVSGTYAEFINNNMLMKEAFGIVNSSFTFEQNGQVSLTLGLFTKNAAELRKATLQDDARFLKLKREQEKLSEEIARIQRVHNLQPPGGESKEVRPYVVLGSAAGGMYPDLDGNEVGAAIDQLVRALRRAPAKPKGAQQAPPHISNDQIKNLEEKLRTYYQGPKKSRNPKVFYFKKQYEAIAEKVIKEKWEALSSTPDPFIVDTPAKNDRLLVEDMGYSKGIKYPYLDQISSYNSSKMIQGAKNIQGIQKKTISFGKLFSVFMVPSLLNLETVEECQIYFYNFNDLACLAAGTNISEFAIDLPEFLLRYKETIANNASTNMTVEHFIQLAVNAQVRDLRAIPYGFRHEKGLLTPWGDKDHPQTAIAEKQEANFGSLAMAFNAGRGGFQQPEIEVLLEVSFKKLSSTGGTGDLLKKYHDSDAIKKPYGATTDRILKIHIYDKGTNPYRKATNFLKTRDGTKFIEMYDSFDPYLKNQQAELDLSSMTKETQNSAESDTKVESQITDLQNNGRIQAEYITTTGGKGDWEKVKRHVSKMIPTLIPGANGSAIMDVSMATNSDPKLASVQMIGMGKSDSVTATPKGSGPGNLPLRVIPAQLSMRTMGMPIVGFTQMFFVDMNTGTSIDNVYGVSGITHTFSPGKFETNLTFAFYDSYGRYESAPSVLDMIKDTVDKLEATERNNKQK